VCPSSSGLLTVLRSHQQNLRRNAVGVLAPAVVNVHQALSLSVIR
jgi:hypothetical protein